MRAFPRWTRATWVTLARAPAWAAAPRLALVGMAGAAGWSATLLHCGGGGRGMVNALTKETASTFVSRRCPSSYLMLPARLTLSSPTTERLPLETMERLLGET